MATGALDYGIDGLDYLAHARNHGFRFHLGRMMGLDRTRKEVILEPIADEKVKSSSLSAAFITTC